MWPDWLSTKYTVPLRLTCAADPHLGHLAAIVLVLIIVVARKAFGIRDHHFADGLVVALVAILGRVLRAGDGQVARGADDQFAVRDHIGTDQRDAAHLRCDGRGAADRQLGTGHGIGGALARALIVEGAGHHGRAIVEAEARGLGVLRGGLRVVGNVERDAVLSHDRGIAFGAHLGALAVDRAVGGEDRQVLARGQDAGARLAGRVVLIAARALRAELHRHRGCRRPQAVADAIGLAGELADRAGCRGVRRRFLVGVLGGGQRIDRHPNREARGLARRALLVVGRVLRRRQVDVLADQRQACLRGDVEETACSVSSDPSRCRRR